MRVTKVSSLILLLFVAFRAPIAHCQASHTINLDVLAATQANVIYTDIGAGFIEITFIGEFDFSSIGGNVDNFSGTFRCHESDLPFYTDYSDPQVNHTKYRITILDFNTFGSSISPVNASIYLIDGTGVYNDGFYLNVDIDYSNQDGIHIPNTAYGLISMGMNAGAYPGTVLTSNDIPKNLNVYARATRPPNLWAVVKNSYQDDPPGEEGGGCFIGAVSK